MPATAVTPRRSKIRTQRVARTRVGLALAGGGPLGGIYEVGALIALADSLEGIDFNDLDAYVGVSSGGFVAAALANGISPAQMYRLFIDDGAEATLSPGLFLRPAFGEFARRAASVPGLLFRSVLDYLRHPLNRGVLESLSVLGRAVPTGVFDQHAIDSFLTRLFEGAGRTNDFRKLSRKLFLVATNLDTGASVTFGEEGLDHVPISKAIQASAALPGLFPPVAIGGEHYVDGALNKTLHASVALDQGVSLLICINPLVPFDASRAPHRGRVTVEKLQQGGLPLVLAQTFRAIIHSRMKVGMEKYRQQYPDADIVLLEPDREDADMFFANIFSYAHRKHLCEAAFRKTRQRLLARRPILAPLLARHRVGLNLARLGDAHRTLHSALDDPRPLFPRATGVRHAAGDLSRTLDHLERWLARA
jgi:NTE family protein